MKKRLFLLFVFTMGIGLLWKPTIILAGQNAFLSKSAENGFPDVLSFKSQLSSRHDKGELLFYLGYAHRHDWEAPVSGLKGRLDSWGMVRADYWVAANVALQVRGVIHNRLRSNNGQFRKTFWDVGDFSVSTVAFFFREEAYRPAFGVRIETKLPNSNLSSGLGTNTTDVLICGLITKNIGRLTFGGEIGLGILTAPKKVNEQNDVLMYRGALLLPLSTVIRLAVEVSGFEVTRPEEGVPLGTESRGVVSAGAQLNFGWFKLEGMALHGLHRRSGEWGVQVGGSWRIAAISKLLKDSE
ncbi:MAG: hypothetical protein Kow0037_00220 [Calditrichia bacterium]